MKLSKNYWTDSLVDEHVEMLQLNYHEVATKCMIVWEAFQVSAMIEKLYSSLADYHKSFMHKEKDIIFEELYCVRHVTWGLNKIFVWYKNRKSHLRELNSMSTMQRGQVATKKRKFGK